MKKLLIHSCCGPCSSPIIEHLSKYFDITLYYYNPCITDENEYNKRADELKRLVTDMKLSNCDVVIGKHEPEKFYKLAKGLEDCPERGERCMKCYAQRLLETAFYAKNNGFDLFTSTLSLSPYKDSEKLNEIGMRVAKKHNLKYFISDFSYLYDRSLELCDMYNLYQQDYCGCEYSKNYSSEIPEV